MSLSLRPARAVRLVSLGIFAAAAVACGGGPAQPVVPQHLEIPVAPAPAAPAASHTSNGGGTQATPAVASDERKRAF